MKQFWKSLSRGKQIALFVTACHFLLAFALSIHHLATGWSLPKKPIAIRTVLKTPMIKQQSPKTTQRVKPSSAPQKKTASSGQKKRKTATLKEINKNLETLASLSKTPASKASALSIPKAVEKRPTAIEEPMDSYAESLVFYLQSALDLPEFGEVKAFLEIAPNGSLQKWEILEAKSQRNGEFLKKRLPELTFPCFNGSDAKQLTLVFRNVEDR